MMRRGPEHPHLRSGVVSRGLHSFTFQLNVSAFHGRGGARRGCLRGVYGGFGGCHGAFQGIWGVFCVRA